MRLQHVSVLFVLIFMPIILVTSYFINLQVRTIKLETSYNEKLINATYDAMTAFELNTANEDLSTVSDSLRGIIDASNNIFFNTLCTNFGISNASKSYIQPYIPAILYTLYDGYYIYAPTNIPEICIDNYGRTIRTSDLGVKYLESKTVNGIKIGFYEFNKNSLEYVDNNPEDYHLKSGFSEAEYGGNKVTELPEEYSQILYKNNDGTYSTQLHTISSNYNKSTYYKRDYILKSYIPYSARYANSSMDITVNYTLDNFVTIEGSIGNTYYTKSGYLINPNLISKIEIGPNDSSPIKTIRVTNWTDYSQEIINNYIEDQANYYVKVYLSDGTQISTRDGIIDVYNEKTGGYEKNYWEDAKSAVKYYVDSFLLSCWVNENINSITASNLKKTEYSVGDIQKMATSSDNISDTQSVLLQNLLYDFSNDTAVKPFEIGTSNNPESEVSTFYMHKRNVIKNSIAYNLMLSMLVYTEESRVNEFNMPVFSEAEWDRIINNVSITSFMEGMKCGLKYYNNYVTVTSTNNEISVTDNEIYYLPRAREEGGTWYLNEIDNKQYIEDNNPIPTAHRIDCPDLVLNGSGAISFTSKEIKYDKILKKAENTVNGSYMYVYDHMAYTDYNCIVDSNYRIKTIFKKSDGTSITEDGNTNVLEYLIKNANSTNPNVDTNLKNQLKEKLKAYRIAIAKERNNLYKTTAFEEDDGFQNIVLDTPISKTSGASQISISLSSLSNKQIKNIRKIEVIIEQTNIITSTGEQVYGISADSLTASFDSGFANEKTYSNANIVGTSGGELRTLEFTQDFNIEDFDVDKLYLKTGDSRTVFKVDAVKVYYK